MQLRTARLLLRPFSERDEAAFFAIERDPDIRRFLRTRGDEDAWESRQRLLAIIECLTIDGYGLLALTLAGTNDVIGIGGLQPCDVETREDLQVLIGILPHWRGQGFAGEALAALLRWAHRDLDRPRVLGVVRANNTASLRLLASAGARYVGERPPQSRRRGEPRELIYEFVSSPDDA